MLLYTHQQTNTPIHTDPARAHRHAAVRMCMCVCVYSYTHNTYSGIHPSTQTHPYIQTLQDHMGMRLCVCLCVCVCLHTHIIHILIYTTTQKHTHTYRPCKSTRACGSSTMICYSSMASILGALSTRDARIRLTCIRRRCVCVNVCVFVYI